MACDRPYRCGKRGRSEMALIHDREAWQSKLAALPLESFDAGETVFARGYENRAAFYILKSGAVSIFKGDIEFAQVTEAGWGVRRALGVAR